MSFTVDGINLSDPEIETINEQVGKRDSLTKHLVWAKRSDGQKRCVFSSLFRHTSQRVVDALNRGGDYTAEQLEEISWHRERIVTD